MFTIYEGLDGRKFRCTEKQAKTLDALKGIQHGGIGTIHGYISESGRVKPEKADIQFITAFSVERLYQRKIKALTHLDPSGVLKKAREVPKLSELSDDELVVLMEKRRDMELASLQKTLDGDRSDARRQAHDTFYVPICRGVKVHLKTFKNANKETELEMVAGLPVADSIMVMMIEIRRKVIEPGEYKTVNSGPAVLMSNVIKSTINQKSISMKTLSLKEGKFDSLVVSRKEILPEDVQGFPEDLFIRAA